MAQLKQCANGHYYDPSMYPSCPYCTGASVGIDRSVSDYGIKTSIPTGSVFTSSSISATGPVSMGSTLPSDSYIGTVDISRASGGNGETVPPEDSVIQDTGHTTIVAPGSRRKQMEKNAQNNAHTEEDVLPDLPERYVVGWLVAVEGPYIGRSFEIYSGNSFIGRDEGEIILKKDKAVSRSKNANTIYDDRENCFYLSAGQSTNLVRVNNKLLPSSSTIGLNPYDLIEIGTSKFRFVPFCSEQFQW